MLKDKKTFQIKLLSHNFEVTFENPNNWNNGALGISYIKDQTIRLNDAMADDIMASTLLHEIVHMVGDLQAIDFPEEFHVSALSNLIFDFMRHNPELIKEICQT